MLLVYKRDVVYLHLRLRKNDDKRRVQRLTSEAERHLMTILTSIIIVVRIQIITTPVEFDRRLLTRLTAHTLQQSL